MLESYSKKKKLKLHINGGKGEEGDNSVGQEILMLLKNKTKGCIKIYKLTLLTIIFHRSSCLEKLI